MEEVGDGDGWPGMGQVVRSPAESAGEEDGGMEATNEFQVRGLLRKEVEGEREDSADEES